MWEVEQNSQVPEVSLATIIELQLVAGLLIMGHTIWFPLKP